jgi:hypothetical protein
MASYLEIRNLFNDADLKNKVVTATLVAASNLADGTPTTLDKTWIASVFNNPQGEGAKAHMAVLAANKGATVAQIRGASDSAIQAQVDNIVPLLVSAMAGV